MPRRREVPKREILPDPKFANIDVAKFINVLMDSGKKSVAERIIYGAFESISQEGRQGSARGLQPGAAELAADGRGEEPARRRRQFPGAGRSAPRAPRRRSPCAGCARRRASAARSRWAQRLAAELIEASEGRGGAVKKREEVHRMAEANKAFSHFRF